jgi:hypothetical protein
MHGIEMRMVTPALIHMLKHQSNRTGKRPPFTQQEWRQLYLFMRTWVKSSKTKKGARERQLIRDYTLIMCNSGLRKGEARYLKWRDLRIYENQHGRWALLNVTGKTGERTVVCQPNTERYFNRMQKRGHNLEPNDYIFCHEDGEPIEYVRGFDIMLKDAGMTEALLKCLRKSTKQQAIKDFIEYYGNVAMTTKGAQYFDAKREWTDAFKVEVIKASLNWEDFKVAAALDGTSGDDSLDPLLSVVEARLGDLIVPMNNTSGELRIDTVQPMEVELRARRGADTSVLFEVEAEPIA